MVLPNPTIHDTLLQAVGVGVKWVLHNYVYMCGAAFQQILHNSMYQFDVPYRTEY